MELNLLHKTELKIMSVGLCSVNLSDLASAVAEVLELPSSQVLVVDVREDHVCLDILEESLQIEQIVGKERLLLDRLTQIPGFIISPSTYVDSTGILGLIGCDESEARSIPKHVREVADEIKKKVLSRAIVYSTGFEVKAQMIEDTNAPFLMDTLKEQGYKVEFGGIIEDDISSLGYSLSDAADRGFGLVITTGGVGAEDKDFSVEALLTLDPDAATPWLVKFERGTGRHVKDGVRIGVAQMGLTTYVSLPGPHDEVIAVAEAIRTHCQCESIDKTVLANDIAAILRGKLTWKEHKAVHGEEHRKGHH